MTDIELQHLLKADPESGQRAFYDRFFNYVYTIVFARLKGCAAMEDIDECVGDVFAQCFIFFDRQNEIKGDLKAFTASVARRKSIDTYRRVVRHTSRSVSLDENEEFVSDENIADSTEQTEMRRILYAKVDELGEPDSTIIIQKYYYGRSSKEIAEIVDMTSDNVRARCSRAIKKLRDMLFEVGFSR
ncbi:MAG: sigma-70 family RNA polymerase sigma factor [Ruminococcus sp.]|uniref:RNA polymerase sigma factor n=1 Tax=Ruminococcus sp. TaxID=41978 RepID=UPI001B71EF13|nr:sigma-70 family RNA polymerase sigma factor [Ruminococcus sp.]MBP5578917.1 sigma-70 family RNA polymerase sigma factor [Ruminococcus sp.]